VAKTQFEHEGLPLRVTVSIGVSTAPTDAQTREALIECADLALYEAKRKGRNRAVVYHTGLRETQTQLLEDRVIEQFENEARRVVGFSEH
jgi:predicted signal transduction protein with EAL and GGDEF domain